ncbi:MAG: zinc ribbon domain-containing protein [Candidatus Poribacteria bacterium]|nr:zinc ribbon domain-containing protein [Candidatus Poribacteria bacterium]
MRTYKYKLQHHKRNCYLQRDLFTIAHVHNHFVALWQRHYKIYGHCEGYKRPSAYRMIKHLTKLKRLAKYRHWTIPYSWCLQECIQRIDRGWQNFFEGRAKRPPKFRSRHKYKSMTFAGSQVKIEPIEKEKVCHACGQIQMFFDLSIRDWYCHTCKINHDRDINAAINIHKVGASTFGEEDVRLASASNPC